MTQKIVFNRHYFLFAVVLFLVEVCIALFIEDRFIRPYVGDVLVVILIYAFFRIFLATRSPWLVWGVFAFSCCVEILQYYNIVEKLGLQGNTLARVVIGTSFSVNDIWAYLAGALLCLGILRLEKNSASRWS